MTAKELLHVPLIPDSHVGQHGSSWLVFPMPNRNSFPRDFPTMNSRSPGCGWRDRRRTVVT